MRVIWEDGIWKTYVISGNGKTMYLMTNKLLRDEDLIECPKCHSTGQSLRNHICLGCLGTGKTRK